MAGELTKAHTIKRKARRWERAFLRAFRNSCNVRASCEAAKISRTEAYDHRREDPEFASLWAQAEGDAIDILEHEAWTRGRAQSDTLLIFLLKAHRPDKYREPVQRYAKTDSEGKDIDLVEVVRQAKDKDADG
jgi:hypothetical protein